MMQHDFCDFVQAKFTESLPLLRLVSGSEQNRRVEQRWLEVALHMQGPDGTLYFPCQGRPWWPGNHYGPVQPGEHYSSMGTSGRYLLASSTSWVIQGLTNFHRVTGHEPALALRQGDRQQ